MYVYIHTYTYYVCVVPQKQKWLVTRWLCQHVLLPDRLEEKKQKTNMQWKNHRTNVVKHWKKWQIKNNFGLF